MLEDWKNNEKDTAVRDEKIKDKNDKKKKFQKNGRLWQMWRIFCGSE